MCFARNIQYLQTRLLKKLKVMVSRVRGTERRNSMKSIYRFLSEKQRTHKGNKTKQVGHLIWQEPHGATRIELQTRRRFEQSLRQLSDALSWFSAELHSDEDTGGYWCHLVPIEAVRLGWCLLTSPAVFATVVAKGEICGLWSLQLLTQPNYTKMSHTGDMNPFAVADLLKLIEIILHSGSSQTIAHCHGSYLRRWRFCLEAIQKTSLHWSTNSWRHNLLFPYSLPRSSGPNRRAPNHWKACCSRRFASAKGSNHCLNTVQ